MTPTVTLLNTDEGRKVFISFLDYLIICSDPLFKRLCVFAKKINAIADEKDKQIVIKYFETETGKKISYFNKQ